MLQAVSSMLDIKDMPPIEAKVKVDCAKTILDKVIEGLDLELPISFCPTCINGGPKNPPLVHPGPKNPNTQDTYMPMKASTAYQEKLLQENYEAKTSVSTKTLPPKDGKYKIVKDDSNRLVKIDGLSLDAKLELNGKIMTHAEALGKAFISGRIL